MNFPALEKGIQLSSSLTRQLTSEAYYRRKGDVVFQRWFFLFAVVFLCLPNWAAAAPVTGSTTNQQAIQATTAAPSETPAAKKPEVSAEPAAVKMGMRGDAVRSVQKLLADIGFYAGALDGIFGNQTLRAVKDFQEMYSLPVDGVVGKETLVYLQRAQGEPSRYSRSLQMRASAYSSQDPGNGNYTARGNFLRKGLVAVDPGVIPLGTRLYIPGYGFAVADDTGGAIRGNAIDLAFETRAEALQFGVQMVTVYIL